ncbi:MAG: NAD-dependent deacylase [Chloroflexota bacterium]|nr:MAG: NAD-dependent deacylase [Chloroflexota bacterium]
MYQSSSEILRKTVDALRASRRVVVLTGAGTSAESGIPTFREAQTGLWSRYDPQELATPQAFAANPQLVWEWYAWRRQLIAEAGPNPAHYALANLQRHVASLTLITQNVDGLHQRAGSTGVVELHGNIGRTICSLERIAVESWPETDQVPPLCPNCQAPLRPDVVWFGESLPSEAVDTAVHAAGICDLFFSIGTSALVQPAASLAHIALQKGAKVAELNAEPTPLTPYADFTLFGQAGELLPGLNDCLPS